MYTQAFPSTNYINQPFQTLSAPMSRFPGQPSWAHEVPLQMPWSAPMDNGFTQFNAHPELHPPISVSCVGSPNQVINSTTPVPLISEPPDETFPNLNRKVLPGSYKRRTSSSEEEDSDSDLQPPPKIHVGADKVAARFSHLDIDPDSDRVIVEELSDDSQDTIFDDDEMSNDQPLVHFSDELQTVIDHKDRVSELFTDELDKSKKALVLWRPPTIIGLEPEEERSSGVTITEIFDDEDEMEVMEM